MGACDANTTQKIVSDACVGKAKCSIKADDKIFGDPCFGTKKNLAAKVSCSGAAPSLTFQYDVVVPVGSVGVVVLPVVDDEDYTVSEGKSVVWKSGKYMPGVPGITGAAKAS